MSLEEVQLYLWWKLKPTYKNGNLAVLPGVLQVKKALNGLKENLIKLPSDGSFCLLPTSGCVLSVYLHFPGQDDVPDRRDDGARRASARLQLRLQLRQEDDRRHEPGLRSAGESSACPIEILISIYNNSILMACPKGFSYSKDFMT